MEGGPFSIPRRIPRPPAAGHTHRAARDHRGEMLRAACACFRSSGQTRGFEPSIDPGSDRARGESCSRSDDVSRRRNGRRIVAAGKHSWERIGGAIGGEGRWRSGDGDWRKSPRRPDRWRGHVLGPPSAAGGADRADRRSAGIAAAGAPALHRAARALGIRSGQTGMNPGERDQEEGPKDPTRYRGEDHGNAFYPRPPRPEDEAFDGQSGLCPPVERVDRREKQRRMFLGVQDGSGTARRPS